MKRFLSLTLAALLLCAAFGCVAIRVVNKYANSEKYNAGGFAYAADAVTEVVLNWASGDVTLVNGTGDLSVSESGAESLSTSERLHWWLDGTTLRIQYCESGFSHVIAKKDKHLTLTVPENVRLNINIASGRVEADALTVDLLDLDTASGGVQINRLTAGEAEIKTASGGVTFGEANVTRELRVDTASGGLTVEHVSAEAVRVDSASGGVTLGLDKVNLVDIDIASGKTRLKLFDTEAGATVRLSKLSGTFDCQLPMTASGKTYTIGSGAIEIDIDSASGGTTIE